MGARRARCARRRRQARAGTRLDVVDAPARPLQRVDGLVVARRRKPRARVRAFGRVQPRLQPEAVNEIGHRAEAVWELVRVGDLLAVGRAIGQHPAV